MTKILFLTELYPGSWSPLLNYALTSTYRLGQTLSQLLTAQGHVLMMTVAPLQCLPEKTQGFPKTLQLIPEDRAPMSQSLREGRRLTYFTWTTPSFLLLLIFHFCDSTVLPSPPPHSLILPLKYSVKQKLSSIHAGHFSLLQYYTTDKNLSLTL